jgi:hypothetical protein
MKALETSVSISEKCSTFWCRNYRTLLLQSKRVFLKRPDDIVPGNACLRQRLFLQL